MFSYENSIFKKYKKPAKIILDIYKYVILFMQYFKLTNPNEMLVIIILTTTFKTNISILFKLINKRKMDSPPTKADNK